jgi:hypothetical protein
MSSILSTILFASAAAAQVTTSFWLPSMDVAPEDVNFQASVVGADGKDVTLAISIDGEDFGGAETMETVTFHGSTAFETVSTITDYDSDYAGDMTVSYGCTKSGNSPVCSYSSNGPAVWSSYCADYSEYMTVLTTTSTYTFDSPSSVVEQVETQDYRDMVPDFCLTGSLLPESYAINTLSVGRTDIETYAVTITAGEELLSATAGATPTTSGASATTKSTGSATPTASSSSPSGSSTGNSTVPAPSPTAPVEQTAAAAPMVTLAPALAGLGALVAALL